jgi:hypothetical protein
MKTHTGKYWLNTLNADTKRRFLKNVKTNSTALSLNDIMKRNTTFSTFISSSFIWFLSEEGREYWEECSKLD